MSVIKVIIVFVIVTLIVYMVITFLNSNTIIMLKVQGIIGVPIIAFLVHIARKIWVLCNMDHPLPENGDSNL